MSEFLFPKLEVLLKAGEAAVQRTRFVFLAISVAGALILSAQFNVTLPWIRNVVLRESVPGDLRNRIEDERWKDLYVVSVPLIGMKFSAFDLGIVGSTGLAVLSVWFFYCARRENHVIDTIVTEALPQPGPQDIDRIGYLYYGIVHHLVFLTIVKSNKPKNKIPNLLAGIAVTALEFIPVWVPLCVLTVDIWSLRAPHKSGIHPTMSLWKEIPSEHSEVICRCIFLLVMVAFSLILCVGATKFASDTRKALNNLRRALDQPP